MEITIQLTQAPIGEMIPPPSAGLAGAWVEFRGIVRAEENGGTISALQYEAYPEMAKREIRRLLEIISARHPSLAVCRRAKRRFTSAWRLNIAARRWRCSRNSWTS